jgi:ribosome-associated protein
VTAEAPSTDAPEAPPVAPVATMDLPASVEEILATLDQGKGEKLVVLDMRVVSGFTDFMVLCSGRSEPHVRALVDAVAKVRRKQGAKAAHVEGRSQGAWVLMDYFDVIVHVFTTENREFYQLERLWRDAPLLEWTAEAPPSA